MPDNIITPQEYELAMQDLSQRLKDYVETGQGNSGQLIREAEELLELKEIYPEVAQRHQGVQGLLAEVLARRQQEKFMASQEEMDGKDAPGCMLGWLLGGGRK